MPSRPRLPRLGSGMSAREKEVLVLLTKGYSLSEIATLLNVSSNYIYSMVKMLKIRFDARTMHGIVAHAIAERIIQPDGTLLDEAQAHENTSHRR